MSVKKKVKAKKLHWPMELGKSYFIRTVTMHYTGKLKLLNAHVMVLSDAAWIADSGRFATALKNGSLNEVEPFPSEVIVPLGGIIDASEWLHALPRDQK